jgi:hypothetical protein
MGLDTDLLICPEPAKSVVVNEIFDAIVIRRMRVNAAVRDDTRFRGAWRYRAKKAAGHWDSNCSNVHLGS